MRKVLLSFCKIDWVSDFLTYFNISSLEQLQEMASHFIHENPPPQIVLLEGSLGSGKTQWVRFAVKALGKNKGVCSPSFTIHNRYLAGLVSVDHFDFYRLKNAEDLESTGFWDLLSSSYLGYVFIEWASRLNKESLPKNLSICEIQFNIIDETTRKLIVSKL